MYLKIWPKRVSCRVSRLLLVLWCHRESLAIHLSSASDNSKLYIINVKKTIYINRFLVFLFLSYTLEELIDVFLEQVMGIWLSTPPMSAFIARKLLIGHCLYRICSVFLSCLLMMIRKYISRLLRFNISKSLYMCSSLSN